MAKHENPRGITLPRGWPGRVKSAMLHVIALGQDAVAYTRSWAVNGRNAVQRLKALCPTLGKAKIAEMLCRAGLHLGATTVGRILKEPPRPMPSEAAGSTDRVVTAKYPNHVWHVDLTTVPTGAGFWAPWLPYALQQCWPMNAG